MSEKRRDEVAAVEPMADAIASALAKVLGPVLDRLAPQGRMTVDEVQAKVMAELRGTGRPAPAAETVERCVSEDTGATFDLWIEGGTVKELRNYTPAPGYDKRIADGGRVPDGMAIDLNDKFGYAKWLSDEWRKDLARFVGRQPFPSMLRAARETIATV